MQQMPLSASISAPASTQNSPVSGSRTTLAVRPAAEEDLPGNSGNSGNSRRMGGWEDGRMGGWEDGRMGGWEDGMWAMEDKEEEQVQEQERQQG
jgi:hypothetical protein